MYKSSFFYTSFILLILFILLCFSTTVSIISSKSEVSVINGNIVLPEELIINSSYSKFLWPTPGFTTITSYFGYRNAPTSGASSYHSGIDIGAPEGTKILAIFSGTVTYTGFSGAGGFTVTVKSKEFTASYCHVSPQFIVSVGEYVLKGTTIANVGPKNVYGVLNNPYKDSFGNPTNGATTGPHLHLTIKKDGQAVNPLDYISSSSLSS